MRVTTGEETTHSTPRPENAVRSNENIDDSKEVAPSDRVELSPRARDIQRAREVAQGAPEVRADKVEAARRAVQSGDLNLKGEDRAEKLVEGTLPG